MKLLFRLAILFLFISLISFSVIRLIPGDPVMHLIGERGAAPERIEALRKNLGLDKSLPVQYIIFTKNIFLGDFGESVISKQPVMSEFRVLFPATVELAVLAITWSSIVGLLLGILAGIKRNSFWDYASVSLSTVGFAMPLFWWGLICIFFFAVQLGWFPVSGRIDVMHDVTMISGSYLIDSILTKNYEALFSALKHLVLPAFVLGTIPLALIVRVTRSSFIDIAKEDYIRTARAKGLSSSKVIYKHILKNALPQILTVIGLSLGQLLTGAIMTETLFSWPGIGRWLIKSIEARDYAVVQAGLFYAMIMILVINILTDEVIKRINPKLRDASR